jgi:PST family polysaccharide transporter
MTLPAHLVSGPIQSTLYTRMVALRGDLPALKSLVLIASRALAGFVFPPMAILCVASGAFVEVFLSERWLPAATLFSIMAPVGALTAVTGLNGPVFMATGRTDLRLRLTIEFTLLWVVAVPLLALQGVTAVAIGQTVIFLLYLPRTLQLYLHPIGASFRDFANAIAIPTLVACGLAALHVIVRTVLSFSTWGEILLAAGEILLGYGALTCALRGRLTSDLLMARRLFAAPAPHVAVADPSPITQK